ncbi:MAG TPA: hypothetical protein VFD66_03490 [Verrucomicrobiae bacterium]|nr:hypothetical protein [Verrucomicrobiae bacterium]
MTKSMAAAGFCAAIFLFIPNSRAADVFVSTNIQAAINAASPGDVIHLAPGRYPEMLTITKSLSLIGSGTNCVIP